MKNNRLFKRIEIYPGKKRYHNEEFAKLSNDRLPQIPFIRRDND